ncbi:HTH-type transcriptional regulator (LysR family protein) [Desulforapulum autotrophicum HRM2]|uniref:HTH-type transcriptional regulator (LysR family protein) n=1 Tax=Desulforapulum autotrophicum (strain ATCC 43914 / DSM 3382 / VKM B-1955 / HRM2) TaxID=177437 RepID=C0QAW4_DESAH|nr:LysR substrate-binding domain-containing protein [Desulforapulum autotrophicum]ACN16897.1 HTH-type transcriptional regulator (LysR family protein) [Desulforapulum autotrophicum HRM2]
MNLPIDYLRTFVSLAETKGFTRTGIQLNRSQSAVSMQIKRLEEEIGKKLFERIGKSVKLTPEGNILIKYAMRIIKEHDDAVRALSKPDLEGFIRFGSPEHYTTGVLPKLLARFASAYPDVLVEMRCENSDKIKEAVDRGEIDIGICTQISDGGQIISHDPVVWVAAPEFIMQKHKTLPIAVFEEDCIFRSWAIEALEKSGIRYRIAYVSRSISGLLDAVKAGIAVAPIILSNVPAELKTVDLEHGLPVLPVSNIVLHKTKKKTSEIIECFSEHIIRFFGEKI